MSWPERALDELGTVSRGRSRHRPRDAAHLYGGPYPFVQTGDVKHSGLYLTEFHQTYSDAGLQQSKLWPVGTLCITIAANIAETSILGIEACFPDSIIGFIPEEGQADTRFIKYLFDAALKKKYKAFTQGAAQDNLSQQKLLSLRLPVPDLPTQERIADILSSYDDLIDNNRRRIELLGEASRQLYKEWFVRFRFPGHEHVKIIDGVPEGWKKKTLTELSADVSYGFTASANAMPVGPKFLRITDIVNDVLDWSTVPYCSIPDSKLAKFSLKEGDVVVARTGATTGYAKRIGKLSEPSVFASYLVRFRFSEEWNDLLAGVYMESADYKSFVWSHIGGAAQPNANAKILGSSKVVVPPSNLQKQFREVVSNSYSQIDNLKSQNTQLRYARDLLLPKLMSGEIAA